MRDSPTTETAIPSALADLTWSNAPLWLQFKALCDSDPAALALVDCEARHWSRRSLNDAALALSSTLRAKGVQTGSRVLVPGNKTALTFALALAVSEIGAVFCPFAPGLGAVEVEALQSKLGHTVLILGADKESLHVETRDPTTYSRDHRNIDTVLIGFTSGTTGSPKAVMHGSAALNYTTRACAAIASLAPGEPILGVMQIDSAAGYAFTVHFSLSLGYPLIMIDKWDPVTAMTLARQHGCGWTILVPTHLFTMVEAARLGLWQGLLPLRTVSVGGSAMTAPLIADARAILGLTPLRMFGMSECLAHCSNQLSYPLERHHRFDGKPFPQTELEAFGPSHRRLDRGERGEAGVRGPALFLGYAEGLGAGQERMTSDGFYLTGDEIIRDDEGFVRVVGRVKDQIIRGGFNIDPAEVEAVLLRHPAIAEAAVVPIPDAKLGEQACAICRIRCSHTAIDLEAMRAHLANEGLFRKKWPEYLVLVDEMLTLPNGKINKRSMAATALEHLRSASRAS